MWDITPSGEVRNRSFTPDEFREAISTQCLKIVFQRGLSALPLIISYLRSQGKLQAKDASPGQIKQLGKLLWNLGQQGALRRCHVAMAEKCSVEPRANNPLRP